MMCMTGKAKARRTLGLSALALALVAPAGIAQTPAPAPLPGGPDFISPVGEPYHSQDKLSGAEHWFQETDTDHDGRMTFAEYMANAERFFAKLDVDHNGEIGPEEIERYETQIAPEIRVVSTGAEWAPHGDDDSSGPAEDPYPERIGAGRFSYIDMPEPILAMDTNFDRGISHKEFQVAARRRFVALDADSNGVLTREELPKISVPHDELHHGQGGSKRRGGRGGHGGMQGGGGMPGGGHEGGPGPGY